MTENDYASLAAQARGLLSGYPHRIAAAANLSALLYQALEDVNWVGFYFLEGETLVLGPFQGKPACVTIPVGRGVCGTAVAENAIQRVADVHAFDGHIACDTASRSELVVPVSLAGEIVGVLDIDSPSPGRFSEADAEGIAAIAREWEDSLRVAAEVCAPV